MKKKKTKNIGKFTRHQIDRHRALLASAPESIEKRQNNIHNRNQMLASTLAYNLGLEKTDAIAPNKQTQCFAKGCHRGIYGNSYTSNRHVGQSRHPVREIGIRKQNHVDKETNL